MNTFSRGAFKLGALSGVLVALIFYGIDGGREVHPIGEPPAATTVHEDSSGTVLIESIVAGVSVMAVIAGTLIGLRRIFVGKNEPEDTDDDGKPDDPFGLDRGVTAKSLGGGLVQVFLRSCRDRARDTGKGPDKLP